MENFNFCVGTRILFGKGQEEKLPELLRPYGNKVLLTYGGGSIKRTGLYDRIKNLLHEFEILNLAGSSRIRGLRVSMRVRKSARKRISM